MRKMDNDKATIREVYQVTQSIESKLDDMRKDMNSKFDGYVTKGEFSPVKDDVRTLMQWRFYFTGIAAAVGAIFALFSEQIRQRVFGG